MSRVVTVAATQMACSWDRQANIANADRLVREAAAKGAQIILIQELFETPYFCQKPNPQYLQLATPVEQNPAIQHFQKLAAELQVVLPISFFELAGRARFNSIAIIDADGKLLGVYRKSHIPDGPGYHEKYYFNPGDTGFKVWNTRRQDRRGHLLGPVVPRDRPQHGADGCRTAVLPDRHRQRAARCEHHVPRPLAARATGPCRRQPDAADRQQPHRPRAGRLRHHLLRLLVHRRPVWRQGREMDETSEGVLVHSFDLDQLEHIRSAWGVFRDRRPNLYGSIKTLDGSLPSE